MKYFLLITSLLSLSLFSTVWAQENESNGEQKFSEEDMQSCQVNKCVEFKGFGWVREGNTVREITYYSVDTGTKENSGSCLKRYLMTEYPAQTIYKDKNGAITEDTTNITNEENAFYEVAKYCVKFQEKLPSTQTGQKYTRSVSGDDGVTLAMNYVKIVYRIGVILISIFCVIVIMVSGIQMSMSGVLPETKGQAKSRLLQSLLSLILLLSSAAILHAVNPYFFTF